jgi:hypothetical protein
MTDDGIAWKTPALKARHARIEKSAEVNDAKATELTERARAQGVEASIHPAGILDLKLEVLLDMLFERDSAEGQQHRLDFRERVQQVVAEKFAELDASVDEFAAKVAAEQRSRSPLVQAAAGMTPEQAMAQAAALRQQIGADTFVPAAFRSQRPPGRG